jgi:hypothetical protein
VKCGSDRVAQMPLPDFATAQSGLRSPVSSQHVGGAPPIAPMRLPWSTWPADVAEKRAENREAIP